MKQPRQIIFEGVGGLKEIHDNCIGQLKYDGAQYCLHISDGKAYALTSKRISKKTGLLSNKFENFPRLKKIKFKNKKETIIACEAVCEHIKRVHWYKRANYVAGIMNSLPDKVQDNKLVLIAFDILYYEGKCVMKYPYFHKYHILKKLFPSAGKFGENIKGKSLIYYPENIIPHNGYTAEDFFNKVLKKTVKKKLEGLVIRDEYYSMKLINSKKADLIITGFTKGNNRFARKKWIGAIEVSAFIDNGDVVKYKNKTELTPKQVEMNMRKENLHTVAKVSGMTDETRAIISRNKKHYLGKIIEVEYKQFTGERLRDPRFKRFREDKLIKRCTLKQFE